MAFLGDAGECHVGAECCLKRMFRRGSSPAASKQRIARPPQVVPRTRLDGKGIDANPAAMNAATTMGWRAIGRAGEKQVGAAKTYLIPCAASHRPRRNRELKKKQP
jgi:hypothetical protein